MQATNEDNRRKQTPPRSKQIQERPVARQRVKKTGNSKNIDN